MKFNQFSNVFDVKSTYLCKVLFEFEQVRLDFSVENHGPEQRKADRSSKIVQSRPLRQNPSQAQQVQLYSSRARDFCQGIWQTLEMGSSPSILSPQKNTGQGKHALKSSHSI